MNEYLESRSPRNTKGHGNHMVSTTGGSSAPNASLYGAAEGSARGMAPKAWLAIYKVCWLGGQCFGSNIVAGFDQAVIDGVDVIFVSLGSSKPEPLPC